MTQSSLKNFFEVRSTKEDAKGDQSNKQSKDKHYDFKRKRTFQKTWEEWFPWAPIEVQKDDEVMYCKYCRAHPDNANKNSALFKGTRNLDRPISSLR